jgi:hypothetical protein
MKALWFLIAGLVTAPVMAAPRTHCGSNEKTFFSCTISGSEKVVSLCGGADHANEVAWVQYRFGAIEHPEMVYPKQKLGSGDKFFAHFENHPEGGFREIWFKVNGFTYLVASDNSVESGEKVDNHVVVYKVWEPIANFVCAETSIDDLHSLRNRILDANDDGFFNKK